MTFMQMETTNQTFGELIGNGVKYKIPRFQRDYAWEKEQWEELWTDMQTLEIEKSHYMGYIVLQRKGQRDFEVVDGQQRIITLSLVILAAMKKVRALANDGYAEENNERLKILTERYIGSKNPISLQVDSKLSLNRNNTTNFKAICSDLETPNKRGQTKTNKLLNECFKFFASREMGKTGQEIAEFVDRVASAMIFTKIVVSDDLNAYKVFETLNARGVQLSTPDLLKNYIFSIVSEDENVTDDTLNELDKDWSDIITQLGENNFTDFIRYHHNPRVQQQVTKKELFLSIRKTIKDPPSAYRYLKSLGKYAPIYASLLNPYDDWWGNQDVKYREARRSLEGFDLFNIKQPFTVLLVAFTRFTPEEFVKLARYLYVLSIRYNVICHLSPNEQETAYNQIANKVYLNEFNRASHVKNSESFKKMYPDDAAFFNAFEYHKMPSRQSTKKIRFLLAEIEEHLGNKTDHNKTTLEHVCPYNPDEAWDSYFGEGVSDIQDRLGNVVLLEKDELKRADFESKKVFYRNTHFPLAKKVAEYQEWNAENLNHYQAWLANQALKTWRVD